MTAKHVNPALTRDYHTWKHERVKEGLRAAERGDLVDHDELFPQLRHRYIPACADGHGRFAPADDVEPPRVAR